MDIHLSAAARNNLMSLKNTSMLAGRTQERLATGLKVNSAMDNATSYFVAKSLNGRAEDMSGLMDDLGQVVQTVKTAIQALESIETLLGAAKAKASQARSTNVTSERASYMAEYNELRTQIQELAADANYRGSNLLGGDSITAEFSVDDKTRDLVINPPSSTADYAADIGAASPAGLGVAAGADWDNADVDLGNAAIDADIAEISAALSQVRQQASSFGTSVSIVETRLNFLSENVNILEEGAGKLVLADQNQESANMLALQTRQQLGTTALSLTSQAEQGVLRLF